MSVEIVAIIKANLEARGVDLSGTCGSFQITARVAWALREDGWGLIAKRPDQNGCTVYGQRFSHDALVMVDGSAAVDLLVNSETENRPAWNATGLPPAGSWRAPWNPDATTEPVPTPAPPASEVPPDALLTLLTAIETRLTELRDTQQQIAVTQEAMRETLNRPHPLLRGPFGWTFKP